VHVEVNRSFLSEFIFFVNISTKHRFTNSCATASIWAHCRHEENNEHSRPAIRGGNPKLTVQTLADSKTGKNVKRFATKKELYADLGL